MKHTAFKSLKSDDSIIELYWQRSESAIEETDKKYRAYLLSIAYNVLADNDESELCLNDTYVRVWNSIPPQRPKSLRAYLAAIIRNCALNVRRAMSSEKRRQSAFTQSLDELELFVADNGTDERMDELSACLGEFISGLDPRRMYVFMSRYYMSRPIEEIAVLLGVSRSTVNKEIAAIKSDLRKKLESEGFEI